jgi:hypothetical protein
MSAFGDIRNDPRYIDLTPEKQREALSYALDEDLKTHPDYETADPIELSKAKESYLDEYLAPDRGFVGDVASRLSRSVVGGIGSTAAGLSTLGSETGEDVYKWSERKLEETPFLQPDKGERRGEEGYVYRSLMNALESSAQSIAPLVAGVGAGLVAGPVAGVALGSAMVVNSFGLGQARKSTDEARKWLTENRPDLSAPEIEEIAHNKGVKDGLLEAGPELAGNAIVALTAGAGLAFKQPLVATLKTLLRPQNFAKKFLTNAAGEYSTELVTSIGQKYAAEKVGMPAPDLWEAVKEPFLTSVFMSVGMGGTVDVYSQVQTARLFRDINAQDQDGKFDQQKRVETASEVIQKIEDPEVRKAWAEIAAKKIDDNEEIDVNLPLVEFGAQKAAEEKETADLGERVKKSLAEGQTTPEEVRAAMPGMQAEGVSPDVVESILKEYEGPAEEVKKQTVDEGGEALAQAAAVAGAQSNILKATSGDEARAAAVESVSIPSAPAETIAPKIDTAAPERLEVEEPLLQDLVKAPKTRLPEVVQKEPPAPPRTWAEKLAREPLSETPVPEFRKGVDEVTESLKKPIPEAEKLPDIKSPVSAEIVADKEKVSELKSSPAQAFIEGMAPWKAKVTKDSLYKEIEHKGTTQSKQAIVEAEIAEGQKVIVDAEGKRSFAGLTEKQLSKPGMDYAEFLSEPPPEVSHTMPDGTTMPGPEHEGAVPGSERVVEAAGVKGEPGAPELGELGGKFSPKETPIEINKLGETQPVDKYAPETDFGKTAKVEEPLGVEKQPWEMTKKEATTTTGNLYYSKFKGLLDIDNKRNATLAQKKIADSLFEAISAGDIKKVEGIAKKYFHRAFVKGIAGGAGPKEIKQPNAIDVTIGKQAELGRQLLTKHKAEVKEAYEAGKTIPENVLADYPDLAPKPADKQDISKITVRVPGKNAAGEAIEVEESATEALQYVDNQLTALEKLKNCLGR